MIGLFLALFLALPASAQQGALVIDHFGGQNDNDSAAVLANHEAQSALNVEANLQGTALLKRQGFTREASLTVATSPVTGSFSFTTDSGDTLVIVCHDRHCAKSTNGSAFSVFLSSAGGANGPPARWSFVSVDGDLYGANDKRDPILKYDGNTLTYPSGIPAGSVIELTEDRLVVGDTSANPSRVAYSQSGVYTNFTTGSASADPWTDDLGSYGDRITGFKYNNGRLHAFKQTSINTCLLGDQFSTVCSITSNSIGTFDANSIIAAPDGVYFRGNDRNYWRIDENGLTLLSQRISNFVKNQLTGTSRNNTQSTQSDWEAGSQSLPGTWNTVSVSGSIFNSSTSFVDSSGADFSSGTILNLSTGDVSGSILLSSSVFQDNFGRGNYTVSPVWTDASGGGWVVINNVLTLSANNGSIYVPQGISTGSFSFQATAFPSSGQSIDVKFISYGNVLSDPGYSLRIEHGGTNNENLYLYRYPGPATLGSFATFVPANGPDNLNTFRIERNASGKFVVYSSTGGVLISATDTTYSSSTYMVVNCNTGNCKADTFYFYSYLSSGSIVSRTYDTTFATATGGPFQVSMSSYADAAVTFEVQQSTDPDDTFGSLSSITPSSRVTLNKRYWRYKASYVTSIATKTAVINDVTLLAATTGTYRTACIQPNSAITTWGILSCSESNIGGGSIVYYSTSAASCAALSTSPASSWVTSPTNNATLTIATNTAVYIGFKSLIGSATDQTQVDSCTMYWTEGTAAQPVWGVYDSIRNSLYWTATTTGSTQGDRVIKYDLNLDQFFPFDLRATALSRINNSLYFGSSTGGYWNKYAAGGVYSDNGSAINAYWKSKDFGGVNPFQETSFNRLSLVAKNQTTGSMTATYAFSSGQSLSHTVSLSTTSSLNYIRDNYNIPLTSPHNFMNVQVGNNSSTPFEVLGMRLEFTTNGWRPVNP